MVTAEGGRRSSGSGVRTGRGDQFLWGAVWLEMHCYDLPGRPRVTGQLANPWTAEAWAVGPVLTAWLGLIATIRPSGGISPERYSATG
ncbi:MAG: hypothetical protein Ct9H300mP12_11240 [Acidimicrobiales bacterium]|nr:MAG: hypothetical protein Ct9H300mP12_11240 [Acidimicrobiales bacterium]